MSSILLFLVVLTLLVLVHEAGHFFTALWTGMKVEEFGVGFPPRAASIMRRGIRYSFNWIPIGGFVKIKGETGENRSDHEAFVSKAPWKRLLVLSAGVIMNMVLAVALFSVGFIFGMPQVVDETLSPQAHVRDEAVYFYTVLQDSPADVAGLALGDELISIDDQSIARADEAQSYIQSHSETSMNFVVARGDDRYTYTLAPAPLEALNGEKGLGVGMVTSGIVSYAWYLAPVKAIEATGSFTSQMVVALVDIVRNLIVEQQVGVELSGPVGIAVMTGQVADMGFAYLIQFAAILSINLAIINFIPFPALDGGRALFVVVEKLRGKPVSATAETIAHNIGFALLMILILGVTFKDVVGILK